MKWDVLAVGAATLWMLTMGAAERFDYTVRNHFFAGLAGNAEELNKGMEICEGALAADPKNAEAMVWHGAGLYYEAGQAFQAHDSQKGMTLYSQAMKELDTAVEIAPDDLGVRIPRGAVLLTGTQRMNNPEMAKPLIEKGVADFMHAYAIQKDRFDKLGTHPRGELLIGIADGYSRLGDQDKAQIYFEQIRKDLPDTRYAKSAALWFETKTPLPADQAGCLGCHTGGYAAK